MAIMKEIITNYIYLLHEREHIRTFENVYKVGMSRQPNLARFNNYPRGSILLFQMVCNDCKFVESIVLQVFNNRFNKCSFYGNEYFQGDNICMMKILYLIIANENKIQQCALDRRSNYIESILKKHNIMDKVTTPVTNDDDNDYDNDHDNDDDNDDDSTPKNDFGLNTSDILNTTKRTYNVSNNATGITPSYNKDQLCKYCGVGYSYSSGLSRHMKECKSRVEVGDNNTSSTATVENVNITDMISIIHKLIEENRELMKLLAYAMKSNQEVINNVLETFTKINATPVINNIYN